MPLVKKMEPLVRSDDELHRSVREILPSGPLANVRVIDESLRDLSVRFGEEVFSVFLRLIFHIELEPVPALQTWEKLMHHHDQLRSQIGAEIDFRVSALDYFTRKTELLVNPTIVETDQFVRLRQDTVTDAMTGLFNFRHFKRMLEKEISHAERYQTPLSLIFLDVDHFKQLNDRCGHPIGDKVLRMVAEVIARSVRSSDLPCRYGGEEFAVIAPATPKSGVLLLAERIRNGVAALEIPEVVAAGMPISISGGVASFPEDAVSVDELIAKSDEALYQAKQGGRNRIETRIGERRRRPRVELGMPGAYSVLPHRQHPIEVRNVSEGGMLVNTSGPLAPGSVVTLEVNLDRKTDPVRCLSKVVHLRNAEGAESYEVGLSIVRMSENDQEKYKQFILSHAA